MNGIVKPKDEFSSLCMAFEEALLIERTNTTALMELVNVAEKDRDIVTVDFITSKFLNEQVSHWGWVAFLRLIVKMVFTIV